MDMEYGLEDRATDNYTYGLGLWTTQHNLSRSLRFALNQDYPKPKSDIPKLKLIKIKNY